MMTLTRTEESTAVTTPVTSTLWLAFELGERTWKLGFTTGSGQRPRMRQIPARATDRLAEELARAKVRFGLQADAPVVSC
jgi:transposase